MHTPTCPHGKAARHLCKWCLAYDNIKPEYHFLIDKARAYDAAEQAYMGGHEDEGSEDDEETPTEGRSDAD